MKRFSDFSVEPNTPQGDKIKIDEILNQDIEILSFIVNVSKYPKDNQSRCLMLQFKLNGKIRVLFTGSDVLIRQIEKYATELPFVARIKKVNRYYTFS